MSKLDGVRSWVWHRLVFLADRISPEDAFRCTGMRTHLKKGVGWVLDDKGVELWYKGQKEYDEHSHDGYDEAEMTDEEVERYVKSVLYWRLAQG